jgi:outer membrane receptor protein involved in Fe transport
MFGTSLKIKKKSKMLYSRFALIALILCLFSNLLQSQNLGNLTGTVKNKNDNPIEFVSLQLLEQKLSTQTDSLGQFKFNSIATGKHTLVILYNNNKTTQQITIIENKINEVTIELNETIKELSEVSVVAKSVTAEKNNEPIKINSIDIKKLQSESSDIQQIINRTPGVRVRQFGGLGSGSNIMINGLQGKAIRFYLDGIPLDYAGYGLQLFNFPVNLIERLEVYKGVVPISLGSDALGGGVNIVTRKLSQNFFNASYQLGSFNTHRVALNGAVFLDSAKHYGFLAKGFYNYTDNNYKMTVPVTDPITLNDKDTLAERFHDKFQSTLGEVSFLIQQKKWTKKLLFTVAYNSAFKELQHGLSVNTIAYGKAHYSEKSLLPSLNYQWQSKNKKLSIDVFAGAGIIKLNLVDTVSKAYGWRGEPQFTYGTGRGELFFNRKSYLFLNRYSQVYRGIIEYKIHQNHSVSIAFTSVIKSRIGADSVFNNKPFDPNKDEQKLSKQVAGINYTANFLKNRITTVTGFKFYKFSAIGSDWLATIQGNKTLFGIDTTTYGFLQAVKFQVLRSLFLRASYENTSRMPEDDEIFGDAILTVSNPKLKPEISHNFNLGLKFELPLKREGFVMIETNGFYRKTNNLIILLPNPFSSYYTNIFGTETKGIELDVLACPFKNLQFSVNGTYQDIRRKGYSSIADKPLEGLRVPNTPYLFANAEVRYLSNYLNEKRADNISVYYFYNYVEEFYLFFAGGVPLARQIIPQQQMHSAGITYSFKNNTYSINFEVQNILDVANYDNLRIQKPGRNFQLKLNFFLK